MTGWMDEHRRLAARNAVEANRRRLRVTITRSYHGDAVSWHTRCTCGATAWFPKLLEAETWATREHECV